MKPNCLMFCLITIVSWAVEADTLSPPTDKPILTVSGLIQHTRDGGGATFDLPELRNLPSDTFKLQTAWSDQPHVYHGPLLSAVLEEAGARGQRLYMRALNDYTTELDVDFVNRYQPILAWKKDGHVMKVRDKGPLWLLFPLHRNPELNTSDNNFKMIWQLSHIEVR
ncbi:hypothetical protein [Marinobacterium arenosum]|uniref:hypothetical protein n=1 Tax=Marinobacterium arenosum TaxID=2862496 RepID=UPI001C956ED7|nr:hypothetical protein [Marinobacterium arenosum]MBY4677131.1 hypothetical protein [Marinobacterium arenosum]